MGKQRKAGFIPYFFDETIGKFKYLMMVSSDARFGGDKPMVSKGGQDPGETDEETALREAEEELGLVRSNLNDFWHLAKKSYKNHKLSVFAGEVNEVSKFTKPCYETEYTLWMTAEDFLKEGREDHRDFIERLEGILRKTKLN